MNGRTSNRQSDTCFATDETAMRGKPLITTVIPTYRRPFMLQRAIQSVLDQTYPHFQVCVYDNASNDDTAEVVETLARRDYRVRYHCHAENIGSEENFSFGLSRVDTLFFNLLSDDDFLLPGFFDQAISALQTYPHTAFFSGGLLRADPEGRVVGFPCYGSGPQQIYSPPGLFYLLAPYTRTWTSILFRQSLLETLGGLKLETGYSFPVDLILRSATRYQAVLSDTPCAVFTVHPASISVAESAEAFESLLTLALFDSVNRAIDSARNDKIITMQDAAEMKAVYRTLTEKNFFHNSFGLIARNRLAAAVRASEVLAEVFKRRDMATVIRVATLENGLGALIRLATRSIKAMRKIWFSRNSTARYSAHSKLVKARMLQLSA